MVEPWFELGSFGAWFGSIAGGGLGTVCGILGAAAGALAPRGKARGFIMGAWYVVIGIGVSLLLVGVYAWAVGQPWGIWYGPIVCGATVSALMGALLPVIRMRYREAEQRRIDAGGLRMT
jgi:hypothetical protein